MGRMVPQQHAYWFRTSQQIDDYEAYLPHPLIGWTPILQAETVARGHEASTRLATTSARIASTPEAALCLARADGIASSRIEGVIASLREVSLWDTARPHSQAQRSGRLVDGASRIAVDAHSVGSNRHVPMRAGDLLALHKTLFEDTGADINAGRFRTGLVWVGSSATNLPSRARFVPAPHAEVPALVDDLLAWVSSRQCMAAAGPVGAAAVAHAQFETAHPFEDGNGRVGRAFLHACLARHSPYPAPLPVSAAIESRKTAYMDALASFDSYLGAPDDDERSHSVSIMIEWAATAVEVACAYAEAVADEVDACVRQAASMRHGTARRAVMDQLIASPAAAVPDLAARLGLSPRTAQRAARRLEDDGLVRIAQERTPGEPLVAEIPSLIDIVDTRTALLAALWQQTDNGQAPDAATAFHDIAPRVELPQPPAAGTCPHIGVRSRVRCILPSGHNGAHRYVR
ncbi:Fic family protein [Candidatus Poriferisodalis sp.]|uniref:Fic family protein n=1 Tax=Candidatus Poriferisodalis sp. TaxID=3101277 RepID=UPI003B52232E